MSGISVSFTFSKSLSKLIEQAGLKAPYAIGRAIDEVGNKTKTQVIRTVAKQAGVKQAKVRGIVTVRQAMGSGNGEYTMIARDATLSLKEFSPRQTRRGVTAAPWGKRRAFAHTFAGPNAHIFVREGKSRLPIRKLWGPNIPKEIVKDEAEKVFYSTVDKLFPVAVEKWLMRQIK